MDPIEIQRRLEAIAQQLIGLGNEIASAEVSMPESARKKFESGHCLLCEKRLDPKKDNPRGCHSKCYQRVYRAIQRGETTDAEEVTRGNLAPRQQGGRRGWSPYESDARSSTAKVNEGSEELEFVEKAMQSLKKRSAKKAAQRGEKTTRKKGGGANR